MDASGHHQCVTPVELLDDLSTLDWYTQTSKTMAGKRHVIELFGYLNPLRAIPIQVVSETESEWIYSLSEQALGKSAPFDPEKVVVIILCGGIKPNPALVSVCEQSDIALVKSNLETHKMLDYIQARLPKFLALKCVLHGVFLAVTNTGVLITGTSGVGKSEVALDLVQRGHQLIADDAVQVHRNEQGELIGECPEALKGFIEIRGLGIINIQRMFGPSAVLDLYRLQMIINLQDATDIEIQKVDRLQPSLNNSEMLGVAVPCLTMLVAPGRNLSVLVEAAARDHLLRRSGVDSSVEFLNRHHELMSDEA